MALSLFRRRLHARAALTAFLALCASSAADASVEISSKLTANMSCSGGVCSPTAKKAVLNVDDLAGMLANGDTKITSGSSAKDIEIDAALSWASSARLTLDSFRSIAFNRPIDVTGSGALTILTNDGGSDGDFQFFKKGHIQFWDQSSGLQINGQQFLLVKNLKVLARQIRRDPTGLYALSKALNARGHGVYDKAPIPGVFEGTVEGLGNAISNLTVADFTDNENVGLFESSASSAVIRDVNLTNANINGGGANQNVGGISGGNSGTILNCAVAGQIFGSGSGAQIGGLVGGNDGTVTRSHASGSISGASGTRAVGGLIGVNGVFGPDPGIVDQDYATGTVDGGDSVVAGGLIGSNEGAPISNSYASATVSGGNNSVVGGLLGSTANDGDAAQSVTASYSTSSVTGGTSATVGGLIGQDLGQTGISDTYWDLDTSGVSDPTRGAGNIANDPGITGLTDIQLKAGLPAGFAQSTWGQLANLNSGYPYLVHLPPT